MDTFSCTESVAGPVLDIAGAGLYGAVAISAEIMDEGFGVCRIEGVECENEGTAPGTLILSGMAALSLVSAIVGVERTRKCREAKAQLSARTNWQVKGEAPATDPLNFGATMETGRLQTRLSVSKKLADSLDIQRYEIGHRIQLRGGQTLEITNPRFIADSVRFSVTWEEVKSESIRDWIARDGPLERTVAISDIKRGLKDRVYRIELHNGGMLTEVTGLRTEGDSVHFWVSKERLPMGVATYDVPQPRTVPVAEVKKLSYRVVNHRDR